MRLNLEPAGSVFVIFRHAAGTTDHIVAANSNIPAESVTRPQLEIQHAAYAATDGTGSLDVTPRVSQAVHDGQLVIEAVTSVLGGDPAPFHVKELRVDYTLDGRSRHATAPEHQTLMLPATASLGSSPQWEPGVAANGAPVVKVWGPGLVDVHTAAGRTLRAEATDLPGPQEIGGPWTLNFPANWGAPPGVKLDPLMSWTDHADAGVRYFSGTATYEKVIQIAPNRLTAGRELWLDLGGVKNFAEVSLNGKNLGVLWKPPFRVDLTGAAKPGDNHLQINITNLWPNRLIGDEQLPHDVEWVGNDSLHAWMAEWLLDSLKTWPRWMLDGQPSPTGRLTFTTWHHYRKDSPLLESGLLGPVTLRTAAIMPAR